MGTKMDSNHSPSKLNNKNLDADSVLQPESKKVKLDDEAECSQVKSETKLVCKESDVLPSSPTSSEGHIVFKWNIHEISETILLIQAFELKAIFSYEPGLCEAK